MKRHQTFALFLSAATTLASTTALRAADPARHTLNFDAAWSFTKGDQAGAEAPAFAAANWSTVSTPHDWAIEGPFVQGAPTGGAGGWAPSGVSWYRKSFTLAPADAGKKIFIDFDGVMANSDVWINGFHLGKRPYGYVGFRYELTDHLNATGPNVIAVRTDTTQQPASRYYEGAGITRHVRLVASDPVHIDYNGTFVTMPKVSEKEATVHVRATVVNQAAAAHNASLQFTLLDPDGKPVGTGQAAAKSIDAAGTADLEADITVANPKLWNLETPVMYTAVATLLSDGKAADDDSVPIGIRHFEFKPATGFWLNDKNFKLKGSCLHAEAGGFGIAVPEDEWIHRLQTLKSFGCNAVRTAHNPPSPEFLSACDKVGIVVMDEMFDCWQTGKNRNDYSLYFREWNQIDTRDTVRRDRNHPSIVLYSAGNEIREPSTNPTLAKTILTGLMKQFHDNDPTRPVTQAILQPNGQNNPAAPNSNPNGSYMNGFADLLDVVGTNYRDQEILQAWREKPTRMIIGTENNKDQNAWAAVRDNPAYSGSFIWTGVDYLGETFAFPSIGSGAGFIDISDRPKGEAYQRGEWWADHPVVYMTRAPAPGAAGPGGPGGPGRGGRGGAPGGAPGGAGPGGRAPGAINPGGPMIPAPAPGGAAPGAIPGPGADADQPDQPDELLAIQSADGFVFIAAPGAPAPGGAAPGGPAAGGRGAGGAGRGGAGAGRGGGAGRGRGPGPSPDWTPANLQPHQETVNVYSNCDSVELFLNNTSLGSKPKGNVDSVRTWQVDFAAGTLKAVGKNKDQVVATNEMVTAGPKSKIVLAPSTNKLFNDFDSVAYLSAQVADDKGTAINTATDEVTFKITGPGAIAAIENGAAQNQNFRGNTHTAVNGQVIAFIRATAPEGIIKVTASAPGLAETTIEFNAAPARR